jgi:hypothetical protein
LGVEVLRITYATYVHRRLVYHGQYAHCYDREAWHVFLSHDEDVGLDFEILSMPQYK